MFLLFFSFESLKKAYQNLTMNETQTILNNRENLEQFRKISRIPKNSENSRQFGKIRTIRKNSENLRQFRKIRKI